MPYQRRGNRPIIRKEKHEVSWSNLGQNASAIQRISLAVAVQPASKNLNTEVAIGSKVGFVYLEFQFSAETISNTKIIHWKVEKVRTGQTPSTPSAYNQNDRRQILQREMEMLPKDVATIIKRIVAVRIPRGYSNFQEGDQLEFIYISTLAETINACGIVIYKEQT